MDQPSLEAQLRQALLESSISYHRVSRTTGVAKSALCRFLQGKTLTLRSAEKLIRFFDFQIRRRQNV